MSDIQEKLKKTNDIIDKTKNKIYDTLGRIEGYSIKYDNEAAEIVEHLSQALQYMQLVKEVEESE